MFELHELVGDWIVYEENLTTACGNRFVIWYFRLGEWLSPEQKHQETHLCSWAKSRLGELGSLEQETLLSKQTSLGFLFCHC